MGRSNGRAMSIEYTGAPASVARSRNAFDASHVAVGASVLLRPPRPWMTTGIPLASDEPDEVVLVGRVEAADRAGRQERDRAGAGAPGLLGEREQLVARRHARRHGPVLATSRWVGAADDDSPAAPAAIASATSSRIVAISASVAARSDASGPITQRRRFEWPT